jgi:hypothetical protein
VLNCPGVLQEGSGFSVGFSDRIVQLQANVPVGCANAVAGNTGVVLQEKGDNREAAALFQTSTVNHARLKLDNAHGK